MPFITIAVTLEPGKSQAFLESLSQRALNTDIPVGLEISVDGPINRPRIIIEAVDDNFVIFDLLRKAGK